MTNISFDVFNNDLSAKAQPFEKRLLKGLLSLPCGDMDSAFGTFADYGYIDTSSFFDSRYANILRCAQIGNLNGDVKTQDDYILKLPGIAKSNGIELDFSLLVEVALDGNSYHIQEDISALREFSRRRKLLQSLYQGILDIQDDTDYDTVAASLNTLLYELESRPDEDDTLIDMDDLTPSDEDGMPLLYIGDAPVFKTQNIQVLTGVAGQGKSQLVKLISGAFFKPQGGGLMSPTGAGRKLLILDTEQDKNDLKKEAAVILSLAGDENKPNIKIRRFVHLDTATRRNRYIQYIKKSHADMVIIDGISDMMVNVNDVVESTAIRDELKMLATKCNCAIVCVIHQNETPDSFKDSKVRGYIGSEITRKGTNVFRVSSKVVDGTKIFTVEDKKSRGVGVPDFSFIINEDGLPTILSGASLSDIKDRQKKGTLSELMSEVFGGQERLSRSEICKRIVEAKCVSERTANSRVTEALRLGIVTQNEDKEYCLCASVQT